MSGASESTEMAGQPIAVSAGSVPSNIPGTDAVGSDALSRGDCSGLPKSPRATPPQLGTLSMVRRGRVSEYRIVGTIHIGGRLSGTFISDERGKPIGVVTWEFK